MLMHFLATLRVCLPCLVNPRRAVALSCVGLCVPEPQRQWSARCCRSVPQSCTLGPSAQSVTRVLGYARAAGNEPPSEQYVALVSRCWSQKEKSRPSFEEIAVELERMYKKLKREQRTV